MSPPATFGRRGSGVAKIVTPPISGGPFGAAESGGESFSFMSGAVNHASSNLTPAPSWKWLFNFNGRIRRSQYWIVKICTVIGYLTLAWSLNMYVIFNQSVIPTMRVTRNVPLLVLLLVANLAVIVGVIAAVVAIVWIRVSAQIRRWHDRGRPWPWIFIGLIPLLGWLWQEIECGLLEGARGPNRFGPSPKGLG